MPKKKIIIGKDGQLKTVVKAEFSHKKSEEPLDRWLEAQGGADAAASGKSKFTGKQGLYVLLGVGTLCLLAAICWGASMLIRSEPDRTIHAAPVEEDDGMRERILNAEEVARAFVQETDAERRLAYVRDSEGVRKRLPAYTEQARNHPVTSFKAMGHSEVGGRAVSSFAVAFGDGSFRLLSVVQMNAGPKVDWDSYARYCSASWVDLFLGKASEAEVRVFVRPGDYHVGKFRDRGKWTCFKLETPDSDRSIYAYAPAGGVMSKKMQTYVMKSRSFRQHMTLKITSREGSGKDALFIVQEVLAMGWVE